jgi:hypothetical protein
METETNVKENDCRKVKMVHREVPAEGLRVGFTVPVCISLERGYLREGGACWVTEALDDGLTGSTRRLNYLGLCTFF